MTQRTELRSSKRKRVTPWVGQWLQARRTAVGIKREDIAKRLDRNVSAIVRLELGASSIPADDLPIVLKAYGVTAGEYAEQSRKSSRAA